MHKTEAGKAGKVDSFDEAAGKKLIQAVALLATIGRLDNMQTFLFGKNVESDLLEFSTTLPLNDVIRSQGSVQGRC